MKLALKVLLPAVLAAFIITPVHAAHRPSAVAYPVSKLTGPAGRQVVPGDARMKVVAALGQPDRRASENVWIYYNYRADNLPHTNPQGCKAMVLTFADAKLQNIKFVNERAAWLITQNAGRNLKTPFTSADYAAVE